jgi:hypothetical protein
MTRLAGPLLRMQDLLWPMGRDLTVLGEASLCRNAQVRGAFAFLRDVRVNRRFEQSKV